MLQRLAGQDVWVIETGAGDPRLFVHCSLAQGRSLRPLAEAMGPAHSTFFDLPGHGKSAAWTNGDYHDDCTAIAAALADGPTHLIGHSFGATVALRLAVEYPEKVSRLTLIEPVMFAAVRDADALAAHHAAFAPFVDGYERGDLATASRVFVGMWGTGPAWPDLPQVARDRIVSQIHMIPATTPVIEHDEIGLVPRLGQIVCPVDLIEGAHTQPVIPAIMAGLQARIPQARRHVIEGAGHMAPITHPTEVAASLR